MMQNSQIKPAKLQKNDRVAIVASASPFKKEAFTHGLDYLKSLGLKPSYQEDIFAKEHYLAGSSQRRFNELFAALLDPSIKAIFFARGGYGSIDLLPLLDQALAPSIIQKIKQNPKIIVGYSDLTVLLNYLSDKLGWVVYYGPVLCGDLSGPNQKTKDFFEQALGLKPVSDSVFSEAEVLKEGPPVAASITGGCLSLVCANLKTPYEVFTKGRILFLEDVNEKPYKVDRMLTQLLLAGKFNSVRALIFANFAGFDEQQPFYWAIKRVVGHLNIPIWVGINAGHAKTKRVIPFGQKVRLDSQKKSLNHL